MSSFKRVLLKLSGESLSGTGLTKTSLDQAACHKIGQAIIAMQNNGIQVGIVIGGGNILRGNQAQALGIPRTPSDQMGMLSTLINGIALEQTIKSLGGKAKVLTALPCPQVAESYQWSTALSYLESGYALIFVGGTGHPYFSTDTAAAMRASEIQANVLLKATKVDGIYTKDPFKFSDAKKYDEISYSQILIDKLNIMDATSIALCRDNRIPILVFNMQLLDQQHIISVLSRQEAGTIVTGG